SQPLSLRSSEFKDFNIYQAMTYSKPAVVLHMLRFYIGDETMRRALRLYFDQNKLTHVDEEDFRRAVEQASKLDLREFFQQWFHTTGTVDYAIANATTTAQANGSWLTRVSVTRNGDNWIPVDLQVAGKTVRSESRERQFAVEVTSNEKPTNAVLDPAFHIIDAKRTNNTFTF
ncbi:MAG TPA: M1 family aminopeptidase, partial [Longimicrobiales bacterium]|nr:M1 family aminopeptidase [Longimicrobiales bacterium]